jgi:hypothetical protein
VSDIGIRQAPCADIAFALTCFLWHTPRADATSLEMTEALVNASSQLYNTLSIPVIGFNKSGAHNDTRRLTVPGPS